MSHTATPSSRSPAATLRAVARAALTVLALAATATAVAAPASAVAPPAPRKVVAVSVQGAWIRWLPNGLPAAGYVTLVNHGTRPVRLVAVDSDAYGSVMLHESITNGSATKMAMVESLAIPAHGQATLAPGGYHLMLMQARRQIAPGETVHLRLHFSDGATLDAPFVVKKQGLST